MPKRLKRQLISILPVVLLVSVYFHYVAYKFLKIPLGIVVVLFSVLFCLFCIYKKHLVNKQFVNVSFILLLYVLILCVSVLFGTFSQGKSYEHILTDIMKNSLGSDYIKFKQSVPELIPSYESISQIVNGLLYTALFPIMTLLFIYYFIFFNNLHNMTSKIVRALLIICAINGFFNIVEYLNPNVHLGLFLIGGYGEGEKFFTYRAISLVLNIYLNAFLNILFFSLSLNQYFIKQTKIWLCITIFSFVLIMISGTRTAMIAAIFIAVLSLGTFSFGQSLKKLKYGMLLLFLGVIAFFTALLIKPDLIDVINTIITLQDAHGSAQLHKYYFLNSIDIILQFPLGIGIGKADFGGFGFKNWLNTESHIMALTIGGGVASFICFMLINAVFLLMSYVVGKTNNQLHFIFPFCLTILIMSYGNMQIFQSLMPVVMIALLYSLAFVQYISNKRNSYENRNNNCIIQVTKRTE